MMQNITAQLRPHTLANQLSLLPSLVLAQMVVRQTEALEGLLRGGADGSTSGDRIINAAAILEESYNLGRTAAFCADYNRGQGTSPRTQLHARHAAQARIRLHILLAQRLSILALGTLMVAITIIAAHWAWSEVL